MQFLKLNFDVCLSLYTVRGLGLWTSRLALTPNPFYLKNGILVDGFEKWKRNFLSENSDWENRISSILPRENDYRLML